MASVPVTVYFGALLECRDQGALQIALCTDRAQGGALAKARGTAQLTDRHLFVATSGGLRCALSSSGSVDDGRDPDAAGVPNARLWLPTSRDPTKAVRFQQLVQTALGLRYDESGDSPAPPAAGSSGAAKREKMAATVMHTKSARGPLHRGLAGKKRARGKASRSPSSSGASSDGGDWLEEERLGNISDGSGDPDTTGMLTTDDLGDAVSAPSTREDSVVAVSDDDIASNGSSDDYLA